MALPEDFDPSNPQSRSEDYLASALGYWDGELPEPQSRVENYLKELAENGIQHGSGILVQTVDQTTDSLVTTRPDGSSLTNEDYIKPKANAVFPFDIGGFTISNKFTRLIYFNNEWILDTGLIQDSSEVPLKDPVAESLDENDPLKLRKNQQQINIEQKNAILKLSALSDIYEAIAIDPSYMLILNLKYIRGLGLLYIFINAKPLLSIPPKSSITISLASLSFLNTRTARTETLTLSAIDGPQCINLIANDIPDIPDGVANVQARINRNEFIINISNLSAFSIPNASTIQGSGFVFVKEM